MNWSDFERLYSSAKCHCLTGKARSRCRQAKKDCDAKALAKDWEMIGEDFPTIAK